MAMNEMEVSDRYLYLRRLKPYYHRAGRKRKAEMLDAAETMTELDRKYLITLLNGSGPHKKSSSARKRRKRIYDDQVDQAVAVIAETLDWICADRLKPTLVETAQQLIRFHEMEVSDEVMEKLRVMSLSSLDRSLARVRHLRRDPLPRARRGRRPDTVAERLIPIHVIPWNEPEAGHFEIDTVQHGPPDGQVIYTIQCIDVLTGWSERFAILGKHTDLVWAALKAITERCPVPFREAHSDNGPEFVNLALIGCLGQESVSITQTRGRKGYCNDNRFVEQKNGSLVRAYLGHLHLYTREHLDHVKALYEKMGPYYNLFQPVLRQIERTAERKEDGTVRITRKHDTAATPLARLLRAKPPISRQTATSLEEQRQAVNPLALKRDIHRRLTAIYKLAAPKT
jgi:IS30 family transposase